MNIDSSSLDKYVCNGESWSLLEVPEQQEKQESSTEKETKRMPEIDSDELNTVPLKHYIDTCRRIDDLQTQVALNNRVLQELIKLVRSQSHSMSEFKAKVRGY